MTGDGFITAFRTLTSLPIPGAETNRRYRALPWFMIVGAILGTIQWICGWALTTFTPALVPLLGVALTVLNCLVTACLHLDGLADTADAFGTPHDREKTLQILKDPHKGTFGTTAIVLALAWRTVACHVLGMRNTLLCIVVAMALSRTLQGLALLVLPYARGPEGKAYGYRGPASVTILLVVQCLLVICAGASYVGLLRSLGAALAGVLIALLVVLAYMRRLGGITGDCLGASTELFELMFMTVAAA